MYLILNASKINGATPRWTDSQTGAFQCPFLPTLLMMSRHGNAFCITNPLCGESTGHQWILLHDDVIKWKHFPRYWPFLREFTGERWIPRTNGQWRGTLMFSLICAWINGWVNNGKAGDLRRHRAHYDMTVMFWWCHDMEILSASLSLCVENPLVTSGFSSNEPMMWNWDLSFAVKYWQTVEKWIASDLRHHDTYVTSL